MKSIKELYRIGTGPSSSHTMGPRKAAEIFLERHPEAASFKVTLYGSLAATGKGHMTNIAITEVLQPIAPVEIIWEPKIFLPFHPNGMKFVSVDKAGKETDQWTVFSIGGGALAEENDGASSVNTPDVYSMSSMRKSCNGANVQERAIGNTSRNVKTAIYGITCKKYGKPCRMP